MDESAHFLQEPAANHFFAAPIDKIVELGTLPVQTDRPHCERFLLKPVRALPLAEWFTGKLVNF